MPACTSSCLLRWSSAGAENGTGVARGSSGSSLAGQSVSPPAKALAGDSDHSQRVVRAPTAAENAYSILDGDSAAARDPARLPRYS